MLLSSKWFESKVVLVGSENDHDEWFCSVSDCDDGAGAGDEEFDRDDNDDVDSASDSES